MLAVVVAVLAAGSASAAEPPADIVLDATVTVQVPALQDDFATYDGGTIRLVAFRTPGDPFQELSAEIVGTSVVFDGVARAADGAPDVLLDVSFEVGGPVILPNGCVGFHGLASSVFDVVASDGLEVGFSELSSVTTLPDCTNAPARTDGVVAVHFVDAVTLLPVDGATVTATARREGHADVVVTGATDADGRAVLTGLPYLPDDSPGIRLDVEALKTETWSDATTGCSGEDSIAAARLDLAARASLEVEFSADEQQRSNLVNCIGGEGPGGGVGGIVGTPGPTPPPTDSRPAGPTGSVLPALLVLGLVAGGALLLAPRRVLAQEPRRRS